MSHNVKLKGVSFTNMDVLQAAIEELKSEGAKVELHVGEGSRFRSWEGRLDPADAVIKCHDGPYDVGLKFNAATNAYEPILEAMFRSNSLTADRSAVAIDGKACGFNHNEAVLGKLAQRYAVINTEWNAAKMGKPTRRVTDTTTGQIHLRATIG